MKIGSDEYIMFIFQHTGFCPQSILVPAKEFIDVRVNDYHILQQHAHTRTFTIDNKEVVIDNLLFVECQTSDTMTKVVEDEEYYNIYRELDMYAEWQDEFGYKHQEDKSFVEKSICGFCSTFDVIEEYLYYKEQTKIRGYKMHRSQKENENGYDVVIVDAFLFLEVMDGKVRVKPLYKTPEEMMEKVYGHTSGNN